MLVGETLINEFDNNLPKPYKQLTTHKRLLTNMFT